MRREWGPQGRVRGTASASPTTHVSPFSSTLIQGATAFLQQAQGWIQSYRKVRCEGEAGIRVVSARWCRRN